jgi:hypothetical protein
MKEENKKYYVYGLYKKNVEYLTNKLDEHLFYIGITGAKRNPINRRATDHRKDRTSNKIKFNIINKYDFEIRILYTFDTKEEAEEREEFLIRWFGKIMDGRILANVLDSTKDQVYKYMSIEDKEKMVRNSTIKKRTKEERIKARDKNLTVPYNQVIEYLEEWVKNPLERHIDFCKRKGICVSKFKGWITLYRPEYLNLVNKIKEEILENIVKTHKDYHEAIEYIQNKFNITRSSARREFRLTKNKLFSIDPQPQIIYTEDSILHHIDSWIKSGLSQNQYTKQNKISKATFQKWLKKYKPANVSSHSEEYRVKQVYDYINSGLDIKDFCSNRFKPQSLKKWIVKYQNKDFKNESNLPTIITPYDWVWKTSPKSITAK